jgi:hypothetical protein
MQPKFKVGDVVYMQALNIRTRVYSVTTKDDVHYYKLENWTRATFSENLLMSESDWQARQEQQAEEMEANQQTAEERRQERLEYVQRMRDNGAWWYGRQGIPWD